MELISQTAVEGRPGPVYPEIYTRLEGLDFNNAKTFARGQPFEAFGRLRETAPVCWHTEPGDLPGFWTVTRHADVMRVNGDPATFSSQRGGILMNTLVAAMVSGPASGSGGFLDQAIRGVLSPVLATLSGQGYAQWFLIMAFLHPVAWLLLYFGGVHRPAIRA